MKYLKESKGWRPRLKIGLLILLLGTLAGWMTAGALVDPLSELVKWIAANSPWPPVSDVTPLISYREIANISAMFDTRGGYSKPFSDYFANLHFTISVLFVASGLAFAPLQLTHARVVRANAQVIPFFEEEGLLSIRATTHLMLVTVMEAVLLLSLGCAVFNYYQGEGLMAPLEAAFKFSGTTSSPSNFQNAIGLDFNSASSTFVVVFIYWFFSLLLVLFTKGLFKNPFKPKPYLENKILLSIALNFSLVPLVYCPLFFTWSKDYNHSPFGAVVSKMITTFVMIKLALLVVLECLSLYLDWRSGKWIRDLARQLTEALDPSHRREAAEKLCRLYLWAKPAWSALESAQNDSDEQVRVSAKEALAHIGQWAENLAKQMAWQLSEDKNRDHRIAALKTLNDLGKWARPAKPALESALRDSDRGIRGLARQTLEGVGRHG